MVVAILVKSLQINYPSERLALVQVPVRFWSVILHKMASQLSSKQESTCSLLCHSEAEIWTCSSAGRHFPSFTLRKVSYCRFIFICGAAHPLSRLKAAASPLSLCHNCQWRITARPPSLPPSLKTIPKGGSHVRRTCNFSSTGRRGGEEVSIGRGDETVLTPRWLFRVDVVEDSGQRNDLRELTSHPDVGSARLTHKNSLAAYRSSLK